ncbi:MAG: TRAP transporter small permease [Desulfobacteraceae bacterium]|nr:MAG: TRAP transporter small permease [Desulfobacteraceae bacterium]
MRKLNGLIRYLNGTLVFVAGAFLVSMIVLTCSNIFLRLFRLPISGTYELMGLLGAVLTSFALGYTQLKKGHVSVSILVSAFPPGMRRIVNGVNHLACMVFFALAAWQISEKAAVIRNTGEVTETLRIEYHPFVYGVALGCGFLALIFFADFFQTVFAKERRLS